MDPRYPIQPWRPFYEIAVSWTVIAVSMWLVLGVSYWFYPLSFILIANRILALSLLCHEGLHRTLHPNGKWNDFLGRYLCAFPTSISFSKYRRLHQLHHSTVGSDRWDPDRHLYRDFPVGAFRFLTNLMARVLTLRTAYDFIMYYMEFPEAFSKKRVSDGHLFILSDRSDFIPFLVFHTTSLSLITYFGVWPEFLLLYLAPLMLLTQPYVILIGGIQHGPMRIAADDVSRNVIGSRLYMWLLLPIDINFHAAHHLDAHVPHYWLKKKSDDLAKEGHALWTESYLQTMRSLFRST
ncbi:MAG: fatty acid desaturase [Bdellovibrionales bacterium]|nr:fatty acid desaturase [Bdellovibrionales bacterium]